MAAPTGDGFHDRWQHQSHCHNLVSDTGAQLEEGLVGPHFSKIAEILNGNLYTKYPDESVLYTCHTPVRNYYKFCQFSDLDPILVHQLSGDAPDIRTIQIFDRCQHEIDERSNGDL